MCHWSWICRQIKATGQKPSIKEEGWRRQPVSNALTLFHCNASSSSSWLSCSLYFTCSLQVTRVHHLYQWLFCCQIMLVYCFSTFLVACHACHCLFLSFFFSLLFPVRFLSFLFLSLNCIVCLLRVDPLHLLVCWVIRSSCLYSWLPFLASFSFCYCFSIHSFVLCCFCWEWHAKNSLRRESCPIISSLLLLLKCF